MRPLRMFVIGLLCAGVAACGGRERITIASKDFTENRLLAEMLALVAEDAGVPVDRVIPYGGSRSCLEAVQRGVVDVYPEYGGTLVSLSGLPPSSDPDRSAAEARAVVAPLGLEWLGRFGVRNDFTLVIRRDLAIRRDVRRISDLTDWPRPLRFAVDEAFGQRMTDGFRALVRRYGLNVESVAEFGSDERAEELRAVLQGDADVAVLYQTDYLIGEFGFTSLEDDLGFFPSYEAAPLARTETLERYPELAGAFERLRGQVDSSAMRELIARVEGGGEDLRRVAAAFLQNLGLLPGTPAPIRDRALITLAVRPLTGQGFLAVRASRALREIMPARPLQVLTEVRPAAAVANGRARYGLIGAEEFLTREDGDYRLDDRLEAVGVVGARMAHIVVTADAPRLATLETVRVGVGPEGSSSQVTAELISRMYGWGARVVLIADEDPVRLLDEGAADVVLITAEPGHIAVTKLLADGRYRLVPVRHLVDDGSAPRYPFLRPARIPAFTYPGQETPVETLSSQVVLATIVPPEGNPVGDTGHSLIPGLGRDLPMRLPAKTAARLQQALGPVEAVDPLLPASPGLFPETRPARARIAGDAASAVMNLLAVAFLVLMVLFYLSPEPARPALRGGEGETESEST